MRMSMKCFPGAWHRSGLDNRALLDASGANSDTTDSAAGHPHPHSLKIRLEATLRPTGDVKADAAFFLRLSPAGNPGSHGG